jgi:hypothetical protein
MSLSKPFLYSFVLIYSFLQINIYLFLQLEQVNLYYFIDLYITDITIDKIIYAIDIAKPIWLLYILITPFAIRGMWNESIRKVPNKQNDKKTIQEHV